MNRRAKAFELYTQDMPITLIAKEIGVSRQTIYAWRRQDAWEECLAEIRAKASEEFKAREVDRRADLAEQAQEGLAHALEEVQLTRARGIDKAAKAALDLAKTVNLLVGKPTDEEGRGPFTFQQLIMVATGTAPGSNRIPGHILDDGTVVTAPVLEGGNGEG